MSGNRGWFLAGLFFSTLATLSLEILDTRLLSVLTWYHLAFLAVSVAMFGMSAGAVHVYRRSADGWTEDGILRPSDESIRRFGSTLAIDGDIILASAPEVRGDSASPATVEAFQYDPASSAWTSLGTLDADELGERSAYGASLALRSGTVYVGAPGVMNGVGAVYVFQYDLEANEWSLQTRLAPFDARPRTRFGTSIVFDDSAIMIGAPGDNQGLGTFYAFGRDAGGNWSSARKVGSSLLEGRAAFSSTAAMGERIAIVGAAGVDGRAGAAVIFERNASGGWDERNMVVNERRGFPAVTGGEVVCENDQAAAFECSDVNIVSFLPVKDIGGGRGTSINDVWGWTDPQSGSEYAIVGRTEGTSFVDVTDPYNPVYLGDLPMTEGSRPSIWRDMKVYRDHVYIVADNAGEHGVQVFNLTQLRTVRNAPVTFSETYLYDGINSAHNIVINEETGYAYAVGTSGGGETCGGGLHMINIQWPHADRFSGGAGGSEKADLAAGSLPHQYRNPCRSHNGPFCLFSPGHDHQSRGRIRGDAKGLQPGAEQEADGTISGDAQGLPRLPAGHAADRVPRQDDFESGRKNNPVAEFRKRS